MSRVSSIRIQPKMDKQLSDLQEWLDSDFTSTVHLAVKKLWQEESDRRNPPKCETCGTPLMYVAPGRFAYVCDC